MLVHFAAAVTRSSNFFLFCKHLSLGSHLLHKQRIHHIFLDRSLNHVSRLQTILQLWPPMAKRGNMGQIRLPATAHTWQREPDRRIKGAVHLSDLS